MKGWLKNKGTSVKTRRGNGSRRQPQFDFRIGAGAKGRKSLGNHKPKCQRWVAPFHKSKVSKRYHDKAFAKQRSKWHRVVSTESTIPTKLDTDSVELQ